MAKRATETEEERVALRDMTLLTASRAISMGRMGKWELDRERATMTTRTTSNSRSGRGFYPSNLPSDPQLEFLLMSQEVVFHSVGNQV